MNTLINLKTLIRHLPSAVVVVDTLGNFIEINPAFKALFRHKDLKKLTTTFDVFQENKRLREWIESVVTERRTVRDRFTQIETHKGLQNMDVQIFPIMTEEGHVLGACAIIKDLSKDSGFTEHQKRLDRIDYLGTIASGLAHEIKNPLSGIKGAAQLLKTELSDQVELSEYARIIEKEVIRVDGLIQELLHFTKPKQLSKERVNLNQVLHDIIQLQRTIRPQRIEYLEHYDPSLPHILGDSNALSQIFLNIITNARQACDQSGQVTITSRMVTDLTMKKNNLKRHFVSVDISDTGPGMNEKDLKKIFTPFYTSKPSGTGLGLALCHQLVEQHEGTIQVHCKKDQGCTFSVLLPI